MKNKKGFTLLELLVVVLIIGILASIALPQYRRAVEKAKLSDALIKGKAIKESIERYFLASDSHCDPDHYADCLDIELTECEWDGQDCNAKDFTYQITGSEMSVYRDTSNIYYILRYPYNKGTKECFDGYTEMGQYICHYLESQGWEYHEGDY